MIDSTSVILPCTNIRVLFIGGAYLDIILHVPTYPIEDEKLRAESVEYRPGGNAFNSSMVLGQLYQWNKQIDTWCGIITAVGGASSDVQSILIPAAQRNGVVWLPVIHKDLHHPKAWIIHSHSTTSRTIINHNDLPHLSPEQVHNIFVLLSKHFFTSNNQDFTWVHFEGRANVKDIHNMMNDVINLSNFSQQQHIILSIELERPNRIGLDSLISQANVIFISHEFARAHSVDNTNNTDSTSRTSKLNSIEECQNWMCHWIPSRAKSDAIAFLTIGKLGALAMKVSDVNNIYYEPALDLIPIDTVGAGDAFIAGVIYAITIQGINNINIPQILKMAVKVAGTKVAQVGVDSLPNCIHT